MTYLFVYLAIGCTVAAWGNWLVEQGTFFEALREGKAEIERLQKRLSEQNTALFVTERERDLLRTQLAEAREVFQEILDKDECFCLSGTMDWDGVIGLARAWLVKNGEKP